MCIVQCTALQLCQFVPREYTIRSTINCAIWFQTCENQHKQISLLCRTERHFRYGKRELLQTNHMLHYQVEFISFTIKWIDIRIMFVGFGKCQFYGGFSCERIASNSIRYHKHTILIEQRNLQCCFHVVSGAFDWVSCCTILLALHRKCEILKINPVLIVVRKCILTPNENGL